MKKVHVLPAPKQSKLFKHQLDEVTLNFSKLLLYRDYGFNIYITNDEEIKEGQNYIGDGFSGKNKFKWHKSQVELYPNIKKDIIILTTDIDLIKEGVQAIDDNFLEWFVKNTSCEEVEIRKIEDELISPKNPKIRFNALQDPPSFISAESLNNMILTYKYEIIIPKEESKQSTKDRIMSETSEETKQKARDYGNRLFKQTAVEWLEEQVIKFHNWKLNQVFDENCFDEIELNKAIQQAKEMEKEQQGYSEEEVEKLIRITYEETMRAMVDWFENNKDKTPQDAESAISNYVYPRLAEKGIKFKKK